MRVLLQKVSEGRVLVEGRIVGEIEQGFVALVGITHDDTPQRVQAMATKVVNLRVFEDEDGKMNLSLLDVGGDVLVVSQFTLYADARKGRRPDYLKAARPEHAKPLVEAFATALYHAGVGRVETGEFGAMMQVSLTNEGPVTIWLDSDELGLQ
jgi:D-tyrosyl-tRNA(Tyr) deacylase